MDPVNPVCLDEARAVAFVSGELAPVARAAVEDHIDDCVSCRQVIAAMVRRTRGPEDVAGTAWRRGARVGRYAVGEAIGRGGMGAVWRAHDVELGRMVALKRLLSGADDEAKARLVREARVAAQLDHANVVTVYEVGEAGGVPYLAMELVDGGVGVGEWAKGKAWRDVVAMMVQAGRGLAAAHARGLVHRDFKPDNVLVDREGRARVADFGLARAAAAPADAAAAGDAAIARMTSTGTIAGTPAYLAPEVVAGALPDARSDQYAFGVTVYEALHGQHPFGGATAAAMWTRMAAGRVKPGVVREVPGWLDACVRKALAPEGGARWGSVAEMVEVMERGAQRRRSGRRRVVGVVAAVAAVLAVAVAVVVTVKVAAQPERTSTPTSTSASTSTPTSATTTTSTPTSTPTTTSTPTSATTTTSTTTPRSMAPAATKPAKKSKEQLWDEAFEASDPHKALALAEQALAMDPGDEDAQRVATYWACFAHDEAKALKHGARLSHHQWQLVIGDCSRADIMLPEPEE